MESIRHIYNGNGDNSISPNDDLYHHCTGPPICPSQFEQLFIMRAPLGDMCAMAVYAYLPSKTKYVYKELLKSIVSAFKDRNIILDPVQVVADYEIGIRMLSRTCLRMKYQWLLLSSYSVNMAMCTK